MSLGEKLNKDYIEAYKQKDAVRLAVLRLLKTAITHRLVELKQPGGSLDDNEIMQLLLKQAKQRRDSIEQYSAANRQDLADREAAELEVLEGYLPKQLNDAELENVIDVIIRESGAAGPQDRGKVMNAFMAKYRGQADGKKVASLVDARLQAIAG